MDNQPKQVAAALLAASNTFPELRIGQLIDNAMRGQRGPDLFYLTDADLCRALYAYINQPRISRGLTHT